MKKLLKNSFFLIVVMIFSAHYALAQEDPVQPPDIGIPCVTKDKGFIVHFTAYQEVKEEERENSRLAFKRFCHDLPSTGKTFVTIDLVDRYTRDQSIALRIVEATAGEKPGTIKEGRTLVKVPKQRYRTGSVETKVNFDKQGLYAAILTLGEEEVSIPIRVGIGEESSTTERVLYIIFGILILAALSYAIYRFKGSQAAKEKKK